jgi:uncharacterized heparinase superfamily protein
MLGGILIVSGPRSVLVERQERPDGVHLRASHDGYAPDFGLIHNRAIRLSPDGRALDGEDSFTPADGRELPPSAGDEYAIRFHLHPAIKANRLSDGHGVILLLPDKDLWSFGTYGETVEIEESVYLAGPDGPRRAVQIVIYGHARQHPVVRWSLRHTPPATVTARPDRAEEPELPL